MIEIINNVTIDIDKENNSIEVYDDKNIYFDCEYKNVTHEEVYNYVKDYIKEVNK
ncbi:MAG: hypothetical protein ACRCTZ_20275 [Sarcina sp.]